MDVKCTMFQRHVLHFGVFSGLVVVVRCGLTSFRNRHRGSKAYVVRNCSHRMKRIGWSFMPITNEQSKMNESKPITKRL